MIICNLTFLVATRLEENWVKFLDSDLIPLVMNKGDFFESSVWEVLSSPNEGRTYSVQFKTNDEIGMKRFEEEYLTQIMEKVHQKFGEEMLLYPSVMKKKEIK